MFKFLKSFAWLIIAIIVLVAVDQLLVRVPLDLPGAKQAQIFYVDFRGRLLGLFGFGKVPSVPAPKSTPTPTPAPTPAPTPKKSIEQVIEKNRLTTAAKATPKQRYLYVDDAGELQFADSLEQVPKKYRHNAQPLAE